MRRVNRDYDLTKYIEPDEELIWSGQPEQGFVLSFTDIIHLCLCTITFYIGMKMIHSAIPYFFPEQSNYYIGNMWMLGAAIILFALMVIGLPIFFYIARLSIPKHSWYAVTNKRAFVFSDARYKQVIKTGQSGGYFTYSSRTSFDSTPMIVQQKKIDSICYMKTVPNLTGQQTLYLKTSMFTSKYAVNNRMIFFHLKNADEVCGIIDEMKIAFLAVEEQGIHNRHI